MFKLNLKWQSKLNDVLSSKKYLNLCDLLNSEYKIKTIYPSADLVFNALNLVEYESVRVVIVGQDPYHQQGQAHGLSFSVEYDKKIPPSLRNIYKELELEINCYYPNHGNLTKWANQGVLMLNSVLTVEQSKPNAHKNWGWEEVTNQIIKVLNERNTPIVFLLWGANAKQLEKFIDKNKHFVFVANHPSPMSANRGGWFNNGCFLKTNEVLKKLNQPTIDWQIENV